MAHKHLDCVTSTGPLSGILARLPRSKTYDIEQVLVTSRDIQHYHHLPFSRKVSCKLGNLHLEIPELESKICVSAHLFFLRFLLNIWTLTIHPAPLLYANFCASAHWFRKSSVALNCTGSPHSPNHRGLSPSAASACTRFKSSHIFC